MPSPQHQSTAPTLQSWSQLSHTLSLSSSSSSTITPSPNPNYKPASADPSLLLPSTFAATVNKRHAAHASYLKQQQQQQHTHLTIETVREAIKALKQLRAHYENLITNASVVRTALSGFDDDSVIWVSPDAQPDFISFILTLNSRWGSKNFSNQSHQLSDLVQWAMDPQINPQLLHANIQSSAAAYQTIEQAFRIFRLAFDDMIQLHDSMSNHDND